MPAVTASSPCAAASLAPRDVLRATWVLFQFSWPGCLPLALVGVAASGVPRGFSRDAQGWGLYVASMALMLICYGALSLRQLSIAAGAPLPVFAALRRSTLSLPAAATTAVIATFAVAAGLVLLVLPGLAVIVWLLPAWFVVLGEERGPIQALRRSEELVRGHFLALAGVCTTLLAAVLVFVLLAGIFFAVIMAIAGQRGPESLAGLSLSRLLFSAVIALPVVYVDAALVVVYRRLWDLRSGPASLASAAPGPGG